MIRKSALTFAAVVAFCGSAVAGTIQTYTFAINDLTDAVTVTDVDSTGRLTASCTVVDGCEFIQIDFVPGAANYSLFYGGSAATGYEVDFLEPGSTSQVSDSLIIGDADSSATFWVFQSDKGGALPLGYNAYTLTEDGTPQQTFTIAYQNVDGVTIGQDVITVQSEIGDSSVPEPATGAIGLAGLIGLGIYRRRRAVIR